MKQTYQIGALSCTSDFNLRSGIPVGVHHHTEPISGVPSQLPQWPQSVVAGTMNFEAGAHLPADKILDRTPMNGCGCSRVVRSTTRLT